MEKVHTDVWVLRYVERSQKHSLSIFERAWGRNESNLKFCHVGSPVCRIQFLTFKFAFLVQKRIQIDAGCGKEIWHWKKISIGFKTIPWDVWEICIATSEILRCFWHQRLSECYSKKKFDEPGKIKKTDMIKIMTSYASVSWLHKQQ